MKKIKIGFSVLLNIILTTLVLVLLFLIQSLNRDDYIVLHSNKIETVNVFQVSDIRWAESYGDRVAVEPGWMKRKLFYEELSKFDSTYHVTNFQPIELNRGFVNEKFNFNYEEGIEYPEYHKTIPVKTISLNFSAYEYHQISQLTSSDGFNQESFIYDGQELPVLLGHEYQEYFNTGDTFKVSYLLAELAVEVVGFLDEEVVVKSPFTGMDLDLSRYIIFPAFEINHYKVFEQFDDLFFDRHYHFLSNGTLISEKSWLYNDVMISTLSREIKYPENNLLLSNGKLSDLLIHSLIHEHTTLRFAFVGSFIMLLVQILYLVSRTLKRDSAKELDNVARTFKYSILIAIITIFTFKWVVLDGVYITGGDVFMPCVLLILYGALKSISTLIKKAE